MLKIEDGAEDIFTKTAANEMAIIETANGNAIDFSCFKLISPLSPVKIPLHYSFFLLSYKY